MGKTHLMHAIGRELMTNYGAMKIVYSSSERFIPVSAILLLAPRKLVADI